MNFFEAQAQAKRNTGLLILLFCLALIGLVLLTDLLVYFVLTSEYGYPGAFTFAEFKAILFSKLFLVVGLGVIILVLGGSLYKIAALSSGGRVIAEMLGGRLIPRSTDDSNEQKLLHIVEEMAIASGMSVPNVYLLEESGINAFAAGHSPQDAIIGVTRGTLENLTRDELQGVIGHEFSHIFNGDMKLNLQLMGGLNGIMLIYMIGHQLLRVNSHSSRRRNNNGAPILFLGLGLMLIGSVGHFFGQWIKAIISRQREYLADASAVQYTRNNQGIGNALKKIGGLSAGSVLLSPSAVQYSHAFFSEGVSHFFSSLLSTHPPLEKRIRRIEPLWNGQYILPASPKPSKNKPPKNKDPKNKSPKKSHSDNKEQQYTTSSLQKDFVNHLNSKSKGEVIISAANIISRIGSLEQENREYAHYLISEIPIRLKKATEEAFGARAVIYALLAQSNSTESGFHTRASFNTLLSHHADPEVAAYTLGLEDEFSALPVKLYLPIVELCIPSLKQLSLNQYKQFKMTIEHLIAFDQTVSMREWFVQRMILQQLDRYFELIKPVRAIHYMVGPVKVETELLLSLIAVVEHHDEKEAEQAFLSGIKFVGLTALDFTPLKYDSSLALDQVMDKLVQLKHPQKKRVIQACAQIVFYDGQGTEEGLELLRAVSSVFEFPMPPLFQPAKII